MATWASSSVSRHHLNCLISYNAFASGYITKQWLREQLTVCCRPHDERHSSENLAIFHVDLFDTWDVTDKVGPVIGDTAANNKVKLETAIFEFLLTLCSRRCSGSLA